MPPLPIISRHSTCTSPMMKFQILNTQTTANMGMGRLVRDAVIQCNGKNVAVFVTRNYGGRHIGSKRFTAAKEHIGSKLFTAAKELEKQASQCRLNTMRRFEYYLLFNSDLLLYSITSLAMFQCQFKTKPRTFFKMSHLVYVNLQVHVIRVTEVKLLKYRSMLLLLSSLQ